MKIVFHIGTNKTGTSSIQGFLHKNPEYLRSEGWVYPLTGRDGGPHHAPLAHTPAPLLPQAVSDIQQEAQDHSVIISSEYLHTIDPQVFLHAFRGHDIQTVVFLRDHVSYLSSWYREGVKSNNRTYSFWDFITTVRGPYSKWLSLWPNLTVIHYDRNSLFNNSAIDHLTQTLDFQTPPPPNQEEENPSISGNLLTVKQILNNFVPYPDTLQIRSESLYLAQIDPTFSGSMYIHDHELEYINKYYEKDRKIISDTYGIDLTPPVSAHKGSLAPDMTRWRSDLDKIQNYCLQHDFLFGTIMSETLCTKSDFPVR